MIASLTMYARPELAPALDVFWRTIRDQLKVRGIDAPAYLSQQAEEFSVWENPALVLSQTCGMPYRIRLHPSVQLVGTPDYGLEGCPAGYYRSAIVVRADDPRDGLAAFSQARLTYNMAHSQSGFAALYAHAAPYGFWFRSRLRSGSHLASARMIAEGQADIAALDAQTWRLIQRYEPWAGALRVLEYPPPTPGLPLITGPKQDPDQMRDAIRAAIEEMPDKVRGMLDLKGLVAIPSSAYMAIPNPPSAAGE